MARLRRQVRVRDREIQQLREENARLRAEVDTLSARLVELEVRLSLNSSNSSRPPSSDPPSAPRKPPKKKPSGRKPGGQPGHPRHTRPLVPEERVDRVIPLMPEKCAECGAPLKGEDPDPQRHQVIEIPEPKAEVTEYRQGTRPCKCGAVTTAALPPGVPTGAFGPRLQAVVGLLSGPYRLSVRNVQQVLQDLLGVPISLGAIVGCRSAVSAALEAPVEEAREFVRGQPVKHADETSWREKSKKRWLWVAATAFVTIFLVHARRNADAAQQLLGRFAKGVLHTACGILVTDRWSAYLGWPIGLRQICWAHLKRDFTWMSEQTGSAARIGKDLLAEVERMFHWWYRVRDGTLERSSFRVYMWPLRRRVRELLEEGTRCRHRGIRGKCRDILALFPALWTFVRVEGVEPTNNRAERAIRAGVLWRKGSFGSGSDEGSRFVERIMTTTASLRQQNRHVFAYLVDACCAALNNEPAPSLLPGKVRVVQSSNEQEAA